jgi:hypothetical protein
MKPRILSTEMPLQDVAEEVTHTTTQLRAYPFLQPQADQAEALLVDVNRLTQEQRVLERGIMDAMARKYVVDDRLNGVSAAIAGTLLTENGGDRSDPVFQRYFGNIQPSRFNRPVLGPQLATMRTWVVSLVQGSPALQAYGMQLTECVAEADVAVANEAEAERQLADFKVDARKALIDRVNGLRLAHYGQLAEMPHTRRELGLPHDFADRFFVRGASQRRLTIPILEKDVARLRTQLQKAEEQLARLREETEAETRQRENEELAEAADELAALEQQRAEAAARVAELQARRSTPGA